jgi:hypothetical protein
VELEIAAALGLLEVAVISSRRLGLATLPYWTAWVLLHLAFLWFASAGIVAIHAMAFRAAAGEMPDGGQFRSRLSRGITDFGALAFAGLAILLGLCVAIVPGIYLAVRWAFVPDVLASGEASVAEALRRSSESARGRASQVLGIVLGSVALNLAGAALLGVGLLATYPVTVLWKALVYRDVRAPLS